MAELVDIPVKYSGTRFSCRFQLTGRSFSEFSNVGVAVYSQSGVILEKYSLVETEGYNHENFKIVTENQGIADIVVTKEISQKIKTEEDYIAEIKVIESGEEEWSDAGTVILFIGRPSKMAKL